MDVLELRIVDLLKNKEEDITISEIAETLKIDRHTAAKHLETLKASGLVEYRSIGKSKVWKISKNPFINALKNNDIISSNFKDILKSVDDHVSIQNKDFSVIWTNKNLGKHKCYEAAGSKNVCKNCPIEKTFKTGNSQSAVVDWHNKKVKIVARPIKDQNNNTIAVVEIVKDMKKR